MTLPPNLVDLNNYIKKRVSIYWEKMRSSPTLKMVHDLKLIGPRVWCGVWSVEFRKRKKQ